MIYLEATRNKCSRCQGNLDAFFSNNTEIYFFNNFWLIKYQSYLHIETSQVFLLFLWLNLNRYMLANHGLSKMGVSVVIRYIFVKYIFCDKSFLYIFWSGYTRVIGSVGGIEYCRKILTRFGFYFVFKSKFTRWWVNFIYLFIFSFFFSAWY